MAHCASRNGKKSSARITSSRPINSRTRPTRKRNCITTTIRWRTQPSAKARLPWSRNFRPRAFPLPALVCRVITKWTGPPPTRWMKPSEHFPNSDVKVMITELDMDVLPPATRSQAAEVSMHFALRAELNPYTNGLPAAVQQQLTHRYADLFTVLVEPSRRDQPRDVLGRDRRGLVAELLADQRPHGVSAVIQSGRPAQPAFYAVLTSPGRRSLERVTAPRHFVWGQFQGCSTTKR